MNNRPGSPNSVPRLITLALSHYCEKARWALDWLKIPYIEESHAPIFHLLATTRHGGRSVPVLVDESGAFTDSTDILHHLDSMAPEGRHLYPVDPELRQEVEQLEELFDTQLGVNVRAWGYYYQMNNPERLRYLWSKGIPWSEQVGLALGFGLMRRMVGRAYNTTATTAAKSLQSVKQIFDTVSNELADGRPYLVGDNFWAADLTFAALAAPALLPPEHPIKPPQLEEINPEMAATIKELRATPAGTYALRLYRRHRHS